MSDLIGKNLGRYRLLEKIGEGGMAVVYKAIDTRLQRTVAIKIILPAHVYTENFRQRFAIEARALAQLYHDNIVLVLDYGEQDGIPYLVTPFIDGGNLKSRLGNPISYWEAARLLVPIACALEYTHKHHIVHRDIKPANILLTADGKPMLSDFGIAKILQAEETLELTGTGVMIGTPEYMAPEQATSSAVDGRADIYALGGVFYEMITGRTPFHADTPFGVIIKKMSDPLPSLAGFAPGLPKAVEQILAKTMAREPEDRYPDMATFATELEKLSLPPQPEPARKQRRLPFFSTGMIIILLAIVAAILIFFSIFLNLRNGNNRPVAGVQIKKSLTSTLPAIGTVPAPAPSILPATTLTATQTNTPDPTRTITTTATNLFTVTATATATSTRAAPKALPPTPSQTVTSTTTNSTSKISLAAGTVLKSSKDGTEMIFVPAGDFIKNIDTGEILPGRVGSRYTQKTVSVEAFWIDKTEVTNAMYAQCAQINVCSPPKQTGSHIRSRYYDEKKYANFPVIYMEYLDAYTYCSWAGKRLPTKDEWEKAASGTDGRQFPWGNTPARPGLLNYYSSERNDTTEVGSYPGGASPYGVLDMSGNVFEWTVGGGFKGGAFNYAERWVLIGSNISRVPGDESGDNLGFRCAANTVP